MDFLDQERDKEVNNVLLALTRNVVIKSAINEQLIQDDDLAMIPEVLGMLSNLAGSTRDDIYKYSNGPLKFPLIQKVFCYNFAKGAEAAYLWNKSPNGQVKISYSAEDAVNGSVGAQIDEKFQLAINLGIMGAENVFCDFQDHCLKKPEYKFAEGGRWLADGIACGLFWASNVGVDYGMKLLGFR